MKTDKIMFIGKILAFSIAMLGAVHDVATFSPLIQDDLTCLKPEALHAVIYMSLICGTSLILSGIILLILLKSAKKIPSLTHPMLITGIFLFFNGILSVVCMYNNPFAWIALLLNTAIFLVTLALRSKLKHPDTD
jgi:hypothetical protein